MYLPFSSFQVALKILRRKVVRFLGEIKIFRIIVFVAKILGAILVINIAIFPMLWILKAALPEAYLLIISYEGLCIATVGFLLLLTSLFSQVEQENHRYVGFGTYRYGLRFKKLTSEQKRDMRLRGILMMTIGVILVITSSYPFLSLLLP
jgi:hypothetical protein